MSETTRPHVLLVDDKESVLELLARILGQTYEVTATADPLNAMALLREVPFDVLVTDIRMPRATGFDLLAAARRCARPPRVVMLTGHASVPDAVEAMRLGAHDYIAKPLDAEEIALVVARALHGPALAPAAGAAQDAEGGGADVPFHDAVIAARDRASRAYLVSLMGEFHGNVTHAARRAGITRESLHRLLKRYGVRSETFKTTGS